ncbi:MAG: MerR family transcriptional regulator [Oscillospiraceae bacterium]
MELVRISYLSQRLGISSRSLRYYEQVGLIESVRLPDEKYRYYTPEMTARLGQIVVLRKMQIPIKDILRIFESEDMSVVVEAFVERIHAIDEEVTALSELRGIVNDFLQTMLKNGVSKISALPLLYEEMDRQLEKMENREAVSYERLSAASERLERAPDIRLAELPSMRVLLSLEKGSGISDPEGLWNWMEGRGDPLGLPGQHLAFEYEDENRQTVLMHRLDRDLPEDCPYREDAFHGGLFAVAGMYADEDMAAFYHRMLAGFDDNPDYEVDYRHDGQLRQPSLLETVFSPDASRERVELFLPVKRRLPDVSRYAPFQQVEGITLREIEEDNLALWARDVPMDGFAPILHPIYRVNEAGEAEYVASVDKRQLSTQVEVKIPFRVDVEFRADQASETYAHGSREGSIRIYHGGQMYGINMENDADSRLSKHAIAFNQPVFGNYNFYPGLGDIRPDEYNQLSWIVGRRHFAVIINGEVRFCGVRFPYMTIDPRTLPAHTVLIGSDGKGMKYFRSVRVTQLQKMPKINMREGALKVITKQSNNMIPNIHQIITMHYGENYWFNGCAKYVMEALGEPQFDYWFFSGLTGDNLAQVFSYDRFRGDGATDYKLSDGDTSFVEDVFASCGYASSFVTERMLLSNREMYLQTLMSYIDRGIPVIFNLWLPWGEEAHGFGWGLFVGYENHGKTLLYLTADKTEPERIPLEAAIPTVPTSDIRVSGWVFVGEKKRRVDIAQLHREVVLDMPRLLTTRTDGYCFGADAFWAWADEIEGGRFDGVKPEEFDDWAMYKIYICNLATNGSCWAFLEHALQKNPDMIFLKEIIAEYINLAALWNGGDGKVQRRADNLESLGGGFNVTLGALQDPQRRKAIAETIRECAKCMDRVLVILKENIGEGGNFR